MKSRIRLCTHADDAGVASPLLTANPSGSAGRETASDLSEQKYGGTFLGCCRHFALETTLHLHALLRRRKGIDRTAAALLLRRRKWVDDGRARLRRSLRLWLLLLLILLPVAAAWRELHLRMRGLVHLRLLGGWGRRLGRAQ